MVSFLTLINITKILVFYTTWKQYLGAIFVSIICLSVIIKTALVLIINLTLKLTNAM